MLMGALAIFTLVAVMGLSIVLNRWRGYPVEPLYPALHGVAALLGSALVIIAALTDTRFYVNIGLAVVIIGLGAFMGLAAKKGKQAPKIVLLGHVSLALVCYGILVFLTLNPQASLI